MDDDGYLLWDIKQEAIAHHLAVPIIDVNMVQGGEVVWVQPLDGQSAWVVVEVVLPVVELSFV